MRIAELWANRIIEGDKKFEDVPRRLKNDVKSILISRGYEHLAK